MNFLKLIESTGYITVSKELARNIGLDETLILTELISKYNYWKENDKLKEGYFYVTIKDLKKETTLTKYRQTKAINNLKELNLIKTKKQGLPAKRYFTIQKNNIIKLFYENDKKEDNKIHNLKSNNEQQNITSEDKKQHNNPSNPSHDLEVKNSKTCKGKNGKLKSENSPQLRINNNNKNNNKKEEEEGQLSTKDFSKKTNDLFTQVFNRPIKPIDVKFINEYALSEEMIQLALERTHEYNGKSLAYLLDILAEWDKRDINTPEEAERLKRQFQGKETVEDYYKKGYR